ncbi:Uu.00g119410.m01.CDS01 [Anthostomella pinea]|uniref:Mitochondrial pyruvate carrier n=1 Tax=Anthostomella pinea TaxID=933095 RepID=A0AAI8YH92_9PEZI|nr:Uu.00g119410.m01.CDS01 [Anthostomella pinea]
MPATTTLFRAARPVFQSRAAFSRTTGFRANFSQSGRRFQSTSAGETAQASWFQRMWNSPVGMKTVHFWAPVMKWALVIAGIGDFARPAEKLSITQNAALTATGLIWTRWCFVIKPRNILLAAVNFFLGCVGVAQLTRIAIHNSSQKNQSLPEKAEAQVEQAKDAAAKEVAKVKDAVKQ